MPYITFTEYPSGPGYEGRVYHNVVVDPDTGKYVCEVAEVLKGEEEIVPAKHAEALERAQVAWQEEVLKAQKTQESGAKGAEAIGQ